MSQHRYLRSAGVWLASMSLLATACTSDAQQSVTFKPQPSSPMAHKSHPRMLFTDTTLPALRQAIGQHYAREFQNYVNWASTDDQNEDRNSISNARHNPIRGLLVHQAFIAALGRVDGISYPIPLEEYARRSYQHLLNRLEAGDQIGYAVPLVYDWTWSYMNDGMRRRIASLVATRTISNKRGNPTLAKPDVKAVDMFSSKYYESCFPFYVGLAFWGDGYIDAEANRAVQTFNEVMLNYGFLDAHNFLAGDAGGWPEWIGYSTWHPRTHMLMVEAWRTATGENYVANSGKIPGNAIKTYPSFLFYTADPHRYFGKYATFIALGGSQVSGVHLEGNHFLQQVYFMPRMLQEAGLPQEAGLVRHFIEHYGLRWWEHEHHSIWGYLGVPRSVAAVSPEQAKLPKSLWTRNMGTLFIRTGFSNPADAVFTITDSHWSRTDRGVDGTPGFTIAKFGNLAGSRVVALRGYGNLNDYPGAAKNNIVYFEGGHEGRQPKISDAPDLRKALNGAAEFDGGGIEQVTRIEDIFYHARSDRSRQYADGVVHTREYIVLPGGNPATDSDFLLIYDRTRAPSRPHWVYHVPWQPDISNHSGSRSLQSGSGEADRIGTAYSGSNMMLRQLNSKGGEKDNHKGTRDFSGGAGAHGVLFAKTLLPQQATMEVTRVAKFDKNVVNRQGDLAIKANRWQVAIIPQATAAEQRFLHVFEAADANRRTNATNSMLLQAGEAWDGVWLERQSPRHSHYAVLFSRDNATVPAAISYRVIGAGATRHIIVGVPPGASYEINDGGPRRTVSTVKEAELWHYQGSGPAPEMGVLYFESSPAAPQTITLTPRK